MGLIMKNGIQYPGVGSGEGSGLEISQLDDVKITIPLADKESLVYNKEIGKWENKKISSESSLPYNLIVSEKWDNNISGGASENTVWTSKIFLTKGTYSIYDYVSWNSSKRIWYRYYFREMSDDFEGYFHGSQDHSQTNVTTDNQGWATFTTNEQFTITKGTAKIQLVFWGDAGQANSGGGTVSLYKIDGLSGNFGSANMDTPIGTIISYMGNNAPDDYLICDGSEYNLADYADLANHFKKEFGSFNYFGGDGITTFAVPDLRGEFLRGSGENSHSKQGSGTNVGEHQDATKHIYTEENENDDWCWFKGATRVVPENYDSTYSQLNIKGQYIDGLIWASSTQGTTFYTSRPTNTSVLYCIKYTKTSSSKSNSNIHEYSEDEQIVGKWIDGKPIYEKTFNNLRLLNRADCIIDLSSLNIENVINAYGLCHRLANDGGSFDYNLPFFESTELYINMRYNKNPKNYSIWCSDSSGTYTANLTVQYTKTTD